MLSSLAIPFHGLGIVTWHAFSRAIATSQVELSLGISLLSGFAIPLSRFGMVLSDALSTAVHLAEVILSNRITVLRHGSVVSTEPSEGVTGEDLVAKMMGIDVESVPPSARIQSAIEYDSKKLAGIPKTDLSR